LNTTEQIRITNSIEQPFVPFVRCITCREQVPQHTAHRVTVTRTENFPDYPMSVPFSIKPGDLWQYSYQVIDPSLTATASISFMGTIPPSKPTHLCHTYTGFACSQEHAEQGVETCPAHDTYDERRVHRAITY